MSDPMAEIKASFFIECDELLEALQDGLETIYDEADDAETINVVFRSVHSIKGGAGAFGLDELVAFAHSFETALDQVRSGLLTVDGDVLKLFFTCGDVLSDLVHESRDELPHDPARIEPVLADLDRLIEPQASDEGTPDDAPVDFEVTSIALDFDLDAEPQGADTTTGTADATWRIDFAPRALLYANGNEPQYLFRALRDLGALTVTCNEPDLPPIAALDPEHAYLGWTLHLTTSEDEATLREVFDFVEDLCELTITRTASGEDDRDLPDLATLSCDDLADTPAPPIATPAPSQTDDAPSETQMLSPAPSLAEEKPESSPLAEKKRAAPAAVQPKATVRVDLDRIDRLVNLVGEIVINHAMLSQSVEAIGIPPNSPVRTGLEEFQQLTRDIQESVMMIRAQPVKSLFQRMSRIVREASSDIGKDVRLRTEGENTEVDKTVIERLADPLTHMIRNAVDHGLEPNEKREAAGKPREGTVHLTALHRSGRVVIEVRDDGAGIDREKVLAKAIDKGLVPPDIQLTESEIDNLLFLPGFSTADEVSSLSGRGVGMDVVRSSI